MWLPERSPGETWYGDLMSLFRQKCPLCRAAFKDDSPLAVGEALRNHFEDVHQRGPAIKWDDVRPDGEDEGEA